MILHRAEEKIRSICWGIKYLNQLKMLNIYILNYLEYILISFIFQTENIVWYYGRKLYEVLISLKYKIIYKTWQITFKQFLLELLFYEHIHKLFFQPIWMKIPAKFHLYSWNVLWNNLYQINKKDFLATDANLNVAIAITMVMFSISVHSHSITWV